MLKPQRNMQSVRDEEATSAGGETDDRRAPRTHAIDNPFVQSAHVSTGTDMHDFPFLMDVVARQAMASTRRILDLDTIAEAFADDDGVPTTIHGEDHREPRDDDSTNTCVDDTDEFGRELRRRLSELGSRTAETRDISNRRDAINELVERAPTTSAMRTWACSLADNLRNIPCTAHSSCNQEMEDIAEGFIRKSATVCDELDRSVQSAVDKASDALGPITSRLVENHEWIRSQSNLIGVHCTSAPRCPVCLVRQVGTFVDPCGHTFCDVCIARCSDKTCCICKGVVRAKRQLFWCG